MDFLPLDRIWERAQNAKEDSDTSYFLHLLYVGEMLTKTVTASLVAAVEDDRDRHRYSQIHRLVRADGLGDWFQVINDVLTGPTSQYTMLPAAEERRELTQRCSPGTWQHMAVSLIHNCLYAIDPSIEALQSFIDGRKWFDLFIQLRNKTRGHGAHPTGVYGQIGQDLERSLRLMMDRYSLFKRQWAYLHRNLSGKYRVTRLTSNTSHFDPLRGAHAAQVTSVPLRDGVYIWYDRPIWVELIESDVDAIDFFFPNGAFTSRRYELISYITGNKLEGDAAAYLAPASELPRSETQGVGVLEVQGRCFGNLPSLQRGYITREGLEGELAKVLAEDSRRPIVTLVGRGGIGKTSLALSVLHQMTKSARYDAILWFSARDIDLLPEGPKLVRPHVLTERDIAKELVGLMQPAEAATKGFSALKYLAQSLTTSPYGRSVLFVLDNFETAQNPNELYTWIETYVRSPNKVLITTRSRDFKADYPVEVPGMSESECEELIDTTADSLGISDLLTDPYRHDLFVEGDGHPYVIKVLLGEVAKAGKLVKIQRIVASKDEILDALFERTYAGLSPVAKRVFLTLSNWRSVVPQLAVEAVLLRPINEKMDVADAIEELRKSSFIDVSRSEEDETQFLTIPLVASLFGRRKLAASPMKSAVEADTALLHAFGAAQASDIRHGIGPRVERMFSEIAQRVSHGKFRLEDHIEMLEFIARNYPKAWLLLASLYEESAIQQSSERAIDAIRRYIEAGDDESSNGQAWLRLAELCRREGDRVGEVHALVEMCKLPAVPFSTISFAANRLNEFLRQHNAVQSLLDTEEKVILVRSLVEVMERRIDEADATDCSRLAWLCLHLRDENRAKQFTEHGLAIDSDNFYCRNLARRLAVHHGL